jgi:hypothetical protein
VREIRFLLFRMMKGDWTVHQLRQPPSGASISNACARRSTQRGIRFSTTICGGPIFVIAHLKPPPKPDRSGQQRRLAPPQPVKADLNLRGLSRRGSNR